MKTSCLYLAAGTMLLAAISESRAALVAHYAFDGSLTADSSGNGYALTQSGTVTAATAGVFGTGGAQFSGGGNFSATLAAGALNLSSMTLSFWTTPDGGGTDADGSIWNDYIGLGSGSQYVVVESAYAASPNLYFTGITPGVDQVAPPGADWGAPAIMTAGQLNHVVFTLDASANSASLYINNVLKTTTAWSGSLALADLIIGSSQAGDARRISATIDEVQIYDTALTATDVDFLFYNPTQVIPEPSTYALFGGIVAGITLAARRRKQA